MARHHDDREAELDEGVAVRLRFEAVGGGVDLEPGRLRQLPAHALGEGVLGGERHAVRIPGFDLGNSPREYVDALAETLILSTTNGTRAVVAAAARCERVFIASLLNLASVVEAARAAAELLARAFSLPGEP